MSLFSWTWSGFRRRSGKSSLSADRRPDATRVLRYFALGLIFGLLWGLAPVYGAPEEPDRSTSPQIERGRRVWLLDALGNLLSLPKKIILLNSRVDSHHVSPETDASLQKFLAARSEATQDVKVRINQWAPVGELKRLTQNKRVEWYWRVFPGIPVTLWSSLTGRLLGGDHYNPYTHTIHLFSDDPAIALHEAGHAVDFAQNPSPGLYAVGRMLAPVELSQEQTASDIAIQHFKDEGDQEGELRAYQTLYPAFGTYGGQHLGLPYGSYIGAGAGHVLGFWQRHERRLGYQALDEARVQDYVVEETELSRVLLSQQEATRRTLLRFLEEEER